MSEEMNWNGFETSEDFVKIQAGIEKVVTLTNPRREDQTLLEKGSGTAKIVPGLVFDVVEEDGKNVKKKMTVTSKRLAYALRPFIDSGRISTTVGMKFSIMKRGEGFDANFEVKEA